MTYRLFVDSSNGVDVLPEFNYKELKEKVENRSRTKTGAEYIYKFGSFNKWKFDVMFVNSSFYAVVNSWWESNTELLFMLEGGSEVNSVRLSNKRQPVNRFIKPHDDLYRGTIELSTY